MREEKRERIGEERKQGGRKGKKEEEGGSGGKRLKDLRDINQSIIMYVLIRTQIKINNY